MRETLLKNWKTSSIGAAALLMAVWDFASRPEAAAILDRLHNMSDLRLTLLAVLFAIAMLRSKD